MESECIKGEGLNFYFPEKNCSPFFDQRQSTYSTEQTRNILLAGLNMFTGFIKLRMKFYFPCIIETRGEGRGKREKGSLMP